MTSLKQKKNHGIKEKEVDENIQESFPASDPPSWSPGQAAVQPKRNKKKALDPRRAKKF